MVRPNLSVNRTAGSRLAAFRAAGGLSTAAGLCGPFEDMVKDLQRTPFKLVRCTR